MHPLHWWDFELQFWGFLFIMLGCKLIPSSSVCVQKYSSEFPLPFTVTFVSPCESQDFLDAAGFWGSGSSKTHSLSYLKCLLICWWQLCFPAGTLSRQSQKSVRGLLACFWILSKTNFILISLTTGMVFASRTVVSTCLCCNPSKQTLIYQTQPLGLTWTKSSMRNTL